MRIIFAGTPEFAARHLQNLIASHHTICAVYTQPDRPAGRGKKLQASPVKQLAVEHNIDVMQPVSLRQAEQQTLLANYNAELMIVVAYGLILPIEVLQAPKYGCINVHASILPRWRGAAPIQRAIEAGDKQSGVTIMQMDVGLDTGDMLSKVYCDILADDTSASLHDRLADIGPQAMLDVVDQIENAAINPEKQDDNLSNYAAKIEKSEALIDWHQAPAVIERKIRAFCPFPISYSFLNGQRLKIYQARIVDKCSAATSTPGDLHIIDKQLVVSGVEADFVLDRIQLPGKKPMATKDYLNGINDQLPCTKLSNQ